MSELLKPHQVWPGHCAPSHCQARTGASELDILSQVQVVDIQVIFAHGLILITPPPPPRAWAGAFIGGPARCHLLQLLRLLSLLGKFFKSDNIVEKSLPVTNPI